MKPKDILEHLETGDRTDEVLAEMPLQSSFESGELIQTANELTNNLFYQAAQANQLGQLGNMNQQQWQTGQIQQVPGSYFGSVAVSPFPIR